MPVNQNNNETPWFEIYPLIAEDLVKYYHRMGPKAAELVYMHLSTDTIFVKYNRWILDFKTSFETPCLDPIQVFCSFNRPKQKVEERVEIINVIFHIFESEKNFKYINFDGCPTPLDLQIRAGRDIGLSLQIWSAYRFLFAAKKQALREFILQNVTEWHGINIPSFTIFLFWISPRYFLPLDKNTFRVLQEAGIKQSLPQTSREYLRLIPKQDVDFYIELVKDARFYKNWEAGRNELINKVRKFYRSTQKQKSSGNQCRLVAIRTLPKLSKKNSKVIEKNKLFRLYKEYEFNEDGTIAYSPANDLLLYDINDLRVEVSAIVGKNGSGKSALTELLLMALSNIAASHPTLNKEDAFSIVKGLHIELYFHTNLLYRVNCEGKNITVTEYFYNGSLFSERKTTSIGSFDLRELFYTIYINYSSYSLNSREMGDWLIPLFYKNDGYQVPLVISPKRTSGIFNINIENFFVKVRLLSLLLEPTDEDEPENFRKLTDSGKYATHISFTKRVWETDLPEEPVVIGSQAAADKEMFVQCMDYFRFNIKGFNAEIAVTARNYIIRKLKRIVKNYPERYGTFADPETGRIRKRTYKKMFLALKKDRSHVTNKLRQAINFFKYRLYIRLRLEEKIDIEKLSRKIEAVKSTNAKEKLRTIELIPPPFYNPAIFLEGEQPFTSLSSGEKQKIYSASSIVYHLKNIDSIGEETGLIAYRNVNILFDELELYYHPDMQRSFVDFLLRYLKRANFASINSLHLCFVTHSPFILSDILDTHTLYLDSGLPVDNAMNGKQTFAGNIHDLLNNSFFLTHGLMGVFAKRQIRSAIDFLSEEKLVEEEEEEKDDEVKEELNEISWDQQRVLAFIERVGEPLLRESLLQMYTAKFIKTESDLEREIEVLRKKFNERKL